jgi:lysophospholipase L1-like esterase
VEAKLAGELAPGRRAYRLNLPLYNGVTSLAVGVRKGAAFEGVKPRREGAILFYGTSITQGGCASRPGMSFTSILGRRLDRPVLNFGFSGNGTTEVEVARFLAELSPAVFVIDTVANTPAGQLKERTEAVVKLLKKERAGVPVAILDGRTNANAPLVPRLAAGVKEKSAAVRAAYDALVGAGVTGVHFRGGEDLIGNDGEATVDGSHPTDLGMVRYADQLEPVLRKALG